MGPGLTEDSHVGVKIGYLSLIGILPSLLKKMHLQATCARTFYNMDCACTACNHVNEASNLTHEDLVFLQVFITAKLEPHLIVD